MEAKLKEEVKDYVFKDWNNKTAKLSSLFGNKQDLILIHNMGKTCPMCTMWADGFNGVLQHLGNRTAFAVISPDNPKTQKKFAKSRNWKFRMLSAYENNFIEDMGFGSNKNPGPGVSVFHRTKDGKIFRVAKDKFGPGDNYCIVYHLFDLLPKGSEGWMPKFEY